MEQQKITFRILNLLKHCSGKVVLTSTLLLITSVLAVIPPWLAKYAVGKVLVSEQLQKLIWVAGLIVLVSFLEGLGSFCQQYMSELISHKVILNLRIQIFEHLTNLSFSFYDKNHTGDLMTRVVSDTDHLKRFLGFALIRILNNFLTIIFIMIVMFIWNWKLGILYCCMIPLMVHGMLIYSRKVRPAFGKIRKQISKITGLLQEVMVGIQTIKYLGKEACEEERFNQQNQQYFKHNLESVKITAFWMPYVNFLIGIGSALILGVGGLLVISNEIQIDILVGFMLYMGMLMRPIRQTGMMLNVYNQAISAGERVFEILDTKSEIKEMEDAKELDNVVGNIEYKNVNFRYEPDHPVLKNISFKVKPGQIVAVVGPTGAGKTTLIHLLPRFYDVSGGEIFIDGQDIKNFKLESLRKNIGIVMQNIYLFSGTIYENIAYGKSDVEFSDVKRAAKIAGLDDFIESLPAKYKTVIGERGVRLSGGQKQRLSLARTILADPKIILLDEVTSNLDAITDEKVWKALNQVIKGKTTFIIAHRMWTIHNADVILVLKDGRIVGQGEHRKLLESCTIYRDLYESQFKTQLKEGIS